MSKSMLGMLVAFGYKAGVGKDTAANYLVSKYGWKQLSFASTLKEGCKELFGLTDYDVYHELGKHTVLSSPIEYTTNTHSKELDWMLSEIPTITPIDLPSSIFGTILTTPRDLLQFIGTEIIRAVYPSFHIDTCLAKVKENNNYVISDLRFPNEAKVVAEEGGYCVRIESTTSAPSKNQKHSSETAMDEFDGWFSTIYNDKNGFDSFYMNIDKTIMEVENAIWWRRGS